MELAWVKEDVGRGGVGPVVLPGGVDNATEETDRGMLVPIGGGTPSAENAGLDEKGGGTSLEED